jgi:hypothetical protein
MCRSELSCEPVREGLDFFSIYLLSLIPHLGTQALTINLHSCTALKKFKSNLAFKSALPRIFRISPRIKINCFSFKQLDSETCGDTPPDPITALALILMSWILNHSLFVRDRNDDTFIHTLRQSRWPHEVESLR